MLDCIEKQDKHKLLQNWFPLKEKKHFANMNKIPKVKEGEVW